MDFLKVILITFNTIILLPFTTTSEAQSNSITVHSSEADDFIMSFAWASGEKLSLQYVCHYENSGMHDKKLQLQVNSLDYINKPIFDSYALIEYHIGERSDRFSDRSVSLYSFKPKGEDNPIRSDTVNATDLVFLDDLNLDDELIINLSIYKDLESQKLLLNITDRINIKGYKDAINEANQLCFLP